jgi:hypothetical protein
MEIKIPSINLDPPAAQLRQNLEATILNCVEITGSDYGAWAEWLENQALTLRCIEAGEQVDSEKH